MSKENKTSLKFARALYSPESIEIAAREFAESAELAISKNKDYTEVLIAHKGDEDISSEFANYALFLTIQSR